MSVTPLEPTPPPQLSPTEKRRRKLLLIILAVLLLLLASVTYLFVRYLNQPEPLPELLPVPVEVSYPPRYTFSIYDVNGPVGVALAPDGERLYVTEMRGDRMIKMFDLDGNLLGSFAPPRTTPGERAPVYVTVDSTGRVFVTDRLQHAIFVYDAEGEYLDTILSPTLTLSEYIAKHTGLMPAPGDFAYDIFETEVHYQDAKGQPATLPRPDDAAWAPLGVRFDANDDLLITDLTENAHSVMVAPASVIMAGDWLDFDLDASKFGASGQGDGQFLFPNGAVADGLSRIIVSDGNNGRLSVWSDQGEFLFHFGVGSGNGALNLPRGLAIDAHDRLHVVDAVGQNVKVYNFSGDEPAFLFAFGSIGAQSGQFNYPNDVALDASGRVFIADRENNRIQVWTY
jgi:sugar lactone lactonase YvrE